MEDVDEEVLSLDDLKHLLIWEFKIMQKLNTFDKAYTCKKSYIKAPGKVRFWV